MLTSTRSPEGLNPKLPTFSKRGVLLGCREPCRIRRHTQLVLVKQVAEGSSAAVWLPVCPIAISGTTRKWWPQACAFALCLELPRCIHRRCGAMGVRGGADKCPWQLTPEMTTPCCTQRSCDLSARAAVALRSSRVCCIQGLLVARGAPGSRASHFIPSKSHTGLRST